jgi:diaminohydroxyphosphoribosylaminopyrimidine deaminase / 5-amino-6-(5-phosphoribosylamino)uracil reductase
MLSKMADHWSEQDHHFIIEALRCARAQSGKTGTNPAVGCVIVKDGRILGQGETADGGRPHAEAVALSRVGNAARGSEVYVTLEPCAHISERGSPCSHALIAAGVTRVVACLTDPDPRTAGRGFEQLRAAGIVVDVGIAKAQAQELYADFIARFIQI